MDPSKLYRTLVDSAVLTEDEGTVRLTESFAGVVETRRSAVEGADDSSGGLPFGDVQLNAYVSALEEFVDLPDGSHERIVPTLVSVHRPPARTAGVPPGFLPLRGEFVRPLVAAFPAAVVYVWKDDCDPCEVMRERLGDVADGDPEGLLFLGVHGPSNAQLLYDEFDVRGAPTTLFVRDGGVDSRLLGSKPASTVEREVEMIRPAVSSET